MQQSLISVRLRPWPIYLSHGNSNIFSLLSKCSLKDSRNPHICACMLRLNLAETKENQSASKGLCSQERLTGLRMPRQETWAFMHHGTVQWKIRTTECEYLIIKRKSYLYIYVSLFQYRVKFISFHGFATSHYSDNLRKQSTYDLALSLPIC